MLKSIAPASLLAVAVMTTCANAQSKIAVVNLTAVFERYQMVHDLEQVFEERRQSVKAEGQKRRDNVTMLGEALRDIRPGTPDFEQRENALITAEVEFRAWIEIQERRLKEQHKTWLLTIYRDSQAVISKLAKERGIELVLSYSDEIEDAPDSVAFKQQILLRSVLFADARINLTNEVIEILDTEYQKRGGAATLSGGGAKAISP